MLRKFRNLPCCYCSTLLKPISLTPLLTVSWKPQDFTLSDSKLGPTISQTKIGNFKTQIKWIYKKRAKKLTTLIKNRVPEKYIYINVHLVNLRHFSDFIFLSCPFQRTWKNINYLDQENGMCSLRIIF